MALNIKVLINEKGAEVFKNLKKDIFGVDAALKKVTSAFAALYVFDKVSTFVQNSIKAFDNSEASLRKLSTALGYNSTLLNNQASALQAVTRFEDDNITAMQATLATYKLSEEQIARLTPAILDMAAATGDDLSATAEKAAKAITTKTNALAREGIELDKGIDKNQKLDSIVAQLTDRFDGQAQALAKVGSGAIVTLSNRFGDLQENIGRIITQNPIFTTALDVANSLIGKLVESTSDLNENLDDMKGYIEPIQMQFLDLNMSMLAGIPITAAYGQTLAEVNTLKFGSAEAITEAMGRINTVAAQSDATLVNYKSSLEKIQKKITEIEKRKAAGKGGSDTGTDTDTPIGTKKEDSLGVDFLAGFKLKDFVTADEIAAEKMAEINAANWERLRDMDVEFTESKFDDLLLAQERELALAEETGASKELIQEYYNAQITKSNEEQALREQQLQRDRQINMLNTAGMMMGSLASLNTAMKGSAKASQALLIGETIMNTSAAVMKILAQGGIFAIPLSIATGIQGAAQVATIASQKFADGGWTPDYGTSRSDSIPAMLSKNERVVSAQETARAGGKAAIDAAISGGGRGGVTVMIEGSVIAHKDWIRDEFLPALERESRR